MLDQAVHLTPGLTGLVAILERPSDTGGPSLYWDGIANAWVPKPPAPDPSVTSMPPHILIVPHPDIPGVYLIRVADEQTKKWPDGYVRIAALNPSIVGPDQVVVAPFDAFIFGGSDRNYPSYTFNILGGSVTALGFRFNAPSLPTS